MHTYIYIYIHTYIHTCTHTCYGELTKYVVFERYLLIFRSCFVLFYVLHVWIILGLLQGGTLIE